MAYYGDGGATPSSPYMRPHGLADPNGPKAPLTKGEIAAIVCSVGLLVGILGTAFYLRYRRAKRNPEPANTAQGDAVPPSNGPQGTQDAGAANKGEYIELKTEPGRTSGSTLDVNQANHAVEDGNGQAKTQGETGSQAWRPWQLPKAQHVHQPHPANMV